MTAVRRIATFDPEIGAFEGWLRGIANNVLRNEGRRARLRAEVERPSLPHGPGVEEATTLSGPPHSELAEQIALTLSELPAAYQEVLRAKYEQGLPVAEIAAISGRTAKTIESLLSRARAAFRKAFTRFEEGR
jgi:RNA polymerase sigma-70 factor (ECF subfamily)